MTFEKIEADTEHPAHKAARTIKEMHEATIALIDKGAVFENSGKDVSQDMRAACVQQIELCQAVMYRAAGMDAGYTARAQEILDELTALQPVVMFSAATVDDELPSLPEVGGYDHEKT